MRSEDEWKVDIIIFQLQRVWFFVELRLVQSYFRQRRIRLWHACLHLGRSKKKQKPLHKLRAVEKCWWVLVVEASRGEIFVKSVDDKFLTACNYFRILRGRLVWPQQIDAMLTFKGSRMHPPQLRYLSLLTSKRNLKFRVPPVIATGTR